MSSSTRHMHQMLFTSVCVCPSNSVKGLWNGRKYGNTELIVVRGQCRASEEKGARLTVTGHMCQAVYLEMEECRNCPCCSNPAQTTQALSKRTRSSKKNLWDPQFLKFWLLPGSLAPLNPHEDSQGLRQGCPSLRYLSNFRSGCPMWN
jgi:hypothetical protein